MTVRFHANRVSASTERDSAAVCLDETGEGTEYLIFQRSRAQTPTSDETAVYVERRGQNWAARGGIQVCELHRNWLHLQVNQRTAAQLGGESVFQITFELLDDSFAELLATLTRIFAGCPAFADRSAGESLIRRPRNVFAETLMWLWQALFGPYRPEAACGRDLLRACEKHQRIMLPPALRDYYLFLGENRVLGPKQGSLLTPECLERVDRHLVIFFGAGLLGEDWCGFALDALPKEDPPIVRQIFDSADDYHWEPESRTLSGFLLRTICWEGLWALPYRATAEGASELFGRIAAQLRLVAPEDPYPSEMRAYAEPGLAVCTLPGEGCLYVGATEEGHLQSFAVQQGLHLQRI